MPRYQYQCEECMYEFEEDWKVDERDLPTASPCPRCSEYGIQRMLGVVGFTVPEGGCGNAANGYSSTHGDAENFKARSLGEPEPFKK